MRRPSACCSGARSDSVDLCGSVCPEPAQTQTVYKRRTALLWNVNLNLSLSWQTRSAANVSYQSFSISMTCSGGGNKGGGASGSAAEWLALGYPCSRWFLRLHHVKPNFHGFCSWWRGAGSLIILAPSPSGWKEEAGFPWERGHAHIKEQQEHPFVRLP